MFPIPAGRFPFLLAAMLVARITDAQQVITPDRNAVALNDLFLSSAWSGAFANPACADSLLLSGSAGNGRGWSAGVFSSRSFLLPELTEGGIALNVKMPGGTVMCGGLSRKGYHLFQRMRVAAGLSRNFGGTFRAGLRFEHDAEVFGEGYGSYGSARLVAGMMARLSARVEAAAVFSKPVRQGAAFVPPYYGAGIYCRFSEHWACSAQMNYRFRQLVFGTTFHYSPLQGVSFSAGVGGRPILMAMGFEIDCRRVRLFVTASHRQPTGLTPSAGFVIPLP